MCFQYILEFLATLNQEDDLSAKCSTKYITLYEFQSRLAAKYETEAWGYIGEPPGYLSPKDYDLDDDKAV